eukprot:490097-Rhodomonas_salina.3
MVCQGRNDGTRTLTEELLAEKEAKLTTYGAAHAANAPTRGAKQDPAPHTPFDVPCCRAGAA